jgi:type I restriction enzyme S subunit
VIETWKDTHLGEVFESITNGVNCDQKSNSGAHLITRIETISKGSVDLERIGRADLNEKELSKYRLVENDILFSHINSPIHVGKTALFDTKAEVYHGVNLLRIRTIKDVNPKFLRYFLLFLYTSGFWRTVAKQSVNQASVNQKDISEVPFSYPSLEKQKEIVEKLDGVFAEIELAKTETIRSIQNLSDLSDSKLDEVFTIMEAEYGMVQSGTIIDVRDGTHDSPSYVELGYPLITSKNLQDGLLDFSKVSFITEEDYQKINRRSKVDVGDLLFAMIGTIGNPVVVMENPLFAIKNVGLFKSNPNYDMTFLGYFLRTPRIRDKFEREAKGTTQRFLGLGYLRTLDIPNVPIKDQLEAVKKLNQFKNELKMLELNLAQRLENFSELKNSIMSSIFAVNSKEGAVA